MRQVNKGNTRFPDTRWTLVDQAVSVDDQIRNQALATLLRVYAPALKAFLIKSRRLDGDLADDIVQDFIADRMLRGQIFNRVDKDRGRLRNYLAKSLWNFASSRLAREQRHVGQLGDVDLDNLEDPTAAQAIERFDQEWVNQLVHGALARMEAECEANGRQDLWKIFRHRVSEPLLQDTEPVGYDQLVHWLGLGSPRQAINLLATAKRSFQRHLRATISAYLQDESLVDSELRDLRQIITR